jgi:TolA-binding protein
VLFTIVIGALISFARIAAAQGLGELNQRLNQIAGQVSAGVGSPEAASQAIDRLDQAEGDFAKLAENGRLDRGALLEPYERLETMLNRMYATYQRRKEACIDTIDNGGTCDYTQPEQLALRALYPLSWLRFEGATLYGSQPATARRLLNQAIDGFTDSTLVILSPGLVRENLLGRAFSERELGKFDHSEYAKAISDFKRIMRDGASEQYRAAEQGLATTYAAMGKLNEAQGLTSQLAENANRAPKQGFEMLRLREMFDAEAAAPEATKRAGLHRQIIDFMRGREGDKDSWAVAVVAAAKYVRDPVGEFGGSDDPFENWILANVLYYRHQPLEAAKYYWAAARSGKYPKGYKYAADLYYSQGRLDLVEQVAAEVAREPGNPDAQWAAYMLFKIPRIQWERTGIISAPLEHAWVAGAQDYLKNYPNGRYAFEPRFRLGEMMQRKGDYLAAARQYEQVAGSPDYQFTARFNAAECYFKASGDDGPIEADGVKATETHNADARPAIDREKIRVAAMNTLREAIRMEPAAERSAPAWQRNALHDSRGRAIYMLAAMLEHVHPLDYREVASMLEGYETAYPTMSTHFNQTYEWRTEALDHTGAYAQLERETRELVAHEVPIRNDYIKQIGIDFWKNGAAKQTAGDHNGYLEDVKLTAATYGYFERMVREGKIPVKNLTGTLSILGQSYLALNQTEEAEAVFQQVVKADPGSPDANAGLARIAQVRKDYKDALNLWSRVESVAAESDPLFYEAKYNMALIFAQEGNATGACNKLAVTRREHPDLGSPGMNAQWDDLQRKLCLNHSES